MKKWKGKKVEHNSSIRTLEMVTAENMPFGYVEAYKSLRTNLKFITATNEAKSFVVTSALGMESKSNISINLAITLAEEKNKVIVVDGDLRKPVVHQMLSLDSHGKGPPNTTLMCCLSALCHPIRQSCCHSRACRT